MSAAVAGEQPATYECGCGFTVVDWTDDVDGFYEAIDDHEQWCRDRDAEPVAAEPVDDFKSRVATDRARSAETFAALPWSDGNAYLLGYFQGLAASEGPEVAGQWLMDALRQRESREAAS